MNSKNSIDARASGVKPKSDIARCSEAAASSQAQAPEHFRICREIFTHTFLNSWKKTLVELHSRPAARRGPPLAPVGHSAECHSLISLSAGGTVPVRT